MLGPAAAGPASGMCWALQALPGPGGPAEGPLCSLQGAARLEMCSEIAVCPKTPWLFATAARPVKTLTGLGVKG